mmetsp:Transcript_49273/g.90883  ORF Transcript_49273/g.90883 Transcript_49273/m.90883 type:complete len:221 (+) Transcript_49273:1599-2261(+)
MPAAGKGQVTWPKYGWFVKGSILAGHCWENSDPDVTGMVTVGYGVAKDFKAFEFDASVSGFFYGEAKAYPWKYFTEGSTCPRRLQGDAVSTMAASDLEEDEVMEGDDDSLVPSQGEVQPEEEEEDEDADERRLGGRRRRRRRRRNITCRDWGVTIGIGATVSGSGRILGIKLSVSGSLFGVFGPWPSPHTATETLYFKVKGCVKVSFIGKVCKSWLLKLA